MKKHRFLTALLLFIFACSLVACQDKSPSETPTPQQEDHISEAGDADPQQEENLEPETPVYAYVKEDGNLAVNPQMVDAPSNEDVILAAYQMYDIANRNDQNCAMRLAYSQCLVTTSGSKAKNVVYEIKNGDEYLKYDFRPTVKLVGIPVADGYGYATYTRLDLEYSYFVDAGESRIRDWVGSADFSNPVQSCLSTPTSKIYFHASQAPNYEAAGAVILPITVTEASITHNDKEGYYEVCFVLDASNRITTKNLLTKLRNSSSMTKKANYTSFVETFQIWDSGMFKHFLSVDEWKAGAISSTIHYDTSYSYTAEDCDLSAYNDNYYATIKALAEAANSEE